MELDSNLQEKIEELQSLEATLQSFLAQRQSIEMELNESNNALEEVKHTEDEVYRVIGNIMIK